MKKVSTIGKILLSSLLVLAVVFSFQSNTPQVEAATTKVVVTTNIYKGKKFLKYPQISKGVSKSAKANINKVLYNHIKKSYSQYLQLKNDMKEIQGEDYCKEIPYACTYAYNVSYKVKYNKDGKLSILVSDYQYAGGAHGNSIVKVYNFNIKNGKPYKLSDALKKKSNFKKVYNYTYRYMEKRPNTFFVEDLNDNLKINNQTQFYFTTGGIYLVFQEYEVGPYSSGTPVVKIPSYVYK